MSSERDMAIEEYMEYAMERARWHIARYPYLADDIVAVAMLALVQAFDRRIPREPKAYISVCIRNAVVNLLAANYLILVPRSEIQRRKEAMESLDNLPRAFLIEDSEKLNTRRSREPAPWKIMQVEDVSILLELTEREKKIIDLRMQGYTNAEVGLEFGISDTAVRKAVLLVKGRYLGLLHNYKGILKPHE